MMRIIAGKYRGRKIEQPDSELTRPTKDRVREAVFNIIAADVPNSSVLDLFAGSGAYGLEALSRGASEAVFVEQDKASIDVIKKNIASLDAGDKTQVIASEALTEIEHNNKSYNIIFSDPPYNIGLAKKTLIMVNRYAILNPLGKLVIEHHGSEDLPSREGDLALLKKKTYGDTTISIYCLKNE